MNKYLSTLALIACISGSYATESAISDTQERKNPTMTTFLPHTIQPAEHKAGSEIVAGHVDTIEHVTGRIH